MKNLGAPVKTEMKSELYTLKPDYDTRLLSSGTRNIKSKIEGNLLEYSEKSTLDVICA